MQCVILKLGSEKDGPWIFPADSFAGRRPIGQFFEDQAVLYQDRRMLRATIRAKNQILHEVGDRRDASSTSWRKS